MERPKKQVAQRRIVIPPPITDNELLAILQSFEGKRGLPLRLAMALREARLELAKYREAAENREKDWQTHERVLLVSEPDGAVEVFTPPWVSVKHVEVRPWDDRDELVQALSAKWKELDAAPLLRVTIVPQVRPKLDDAALAELAKWHDRVTAFEKILELRKK